MSEHRLLSSSQAGNNLAIRGVFLTTRLLNGPVNGRFWTCVKMPPTQRVCVSPQVLPVVSFGTYQNDLGQATKNVGRF